MPKYRIELAELVRQTATVVVEADNKQQAQFYIKEIYDAEGGEACAEWVPDLEWGAEYGDSSYVHSEAPEDTFAHFSIRDGEVCANERILPSEQMCEFFVAEVNNCADSGEEPTIGCAANSLRQMPTDVLIDAVGEYGQDWIDDEGASHSFDRKDFEHEFEGLRAAYGDNYLLTEFVCSNEG